MVRYRWRTALEASYLIEMDSNHTSMEMREAELRPAVATVEEWQAPRRPLSATPFKFEIGQEVACLTGETGRILRRWHSLLDPRYSMKREVDGVILHLYESELRAVTQPARSCETP